MSNLISEIDEFLQYVSGFNGFCVRRVDSSQAWQFSSVEVDLDDISIRFYRDMGRTLAQVRPAGVLQWLDLPYVFAYLRQPQRLPTEGPMLAQFVTRNLEIIRSTVGGQWEALLRFTGEQQLRLLNMLQGKATLFPEGGESE